MPFNRLPEVDKCCGCVTDLKTASAIIAVLGIVTSPAVAWAVVRHSYVIRVSCFITTSAIRPDVVDINLNNILSFGFGANAGLGPSCLGPKNKTTTSAPTFRAEETEAQSSSKFVKSVRWMGWVVLVADMIFLLFSIYFLYRLFMPPEKYAAKRFMLACILAITLSFIYGMLYVASCISVGGSFPVFEFLFCVVDIMIFAMWIYFIIVIHSFIQTCDSAANNQGLIAKYMPRITPEEMWSYLYNYIATLLGYISL